MSEPSTNSDDWIPLAVLPPDDNTMVLWMFDPPKKYRQSYLGAKWYPAVMEGIIWRHPKIKQVYVEARRERFKIQWFSHWRPMPAPIERKKK